MDQRVHPEEFLGLSTGGTYPTLLNMLSSHVLARNPCNTERGWPSAKRNFRYCRSRQHHSNHGYHCHSSHKSVYTVPSLSSGQNLTYISFTDCGLALISDEHVCKTLEPRSAEQLAKYDVEDFCFTEYVFYIGLLSDNLLMADSQCPEKCKGRYCLFERASVCKEGDESVRVCI
jgi:hypothetical protein